MKGVVNATNACVFVQSAQAVIVNGSSTETHGAERVRERTCGAVLPALEIDDV